MFKTDPEGEQSPLGDLAEALVQSTPVGYILRNGQPENIYKSKIIYTYYVILTYVGAHTHYYIHI